MPFLNLSPSAALMGWYVLLWGAMAISPADWQNWMLASRIPALLVGALMAGRRALPLTLASYVMIGAFLSLHTIGAHYTYAWMPLGDELAFMLGSGRNEYDRVVHFAFGLRLASPIRDAFARVAKRPRVSSLLSARDDHRRPERPLGDLGTLGGSDRQPGAWRGVSGQPGRCLGRPEGHDRSALRGAALGRPERVGALAQRRRRDGLRREPA